LDVKIQEYKIKRRNSKENEGAVKVLEMKLISSLINIIKHSLYGYMYEIGPASVCLRESEGKTFS